MYIVHSSSWISIMYEDWRYLLWSNAYLWKILFHFSCKINPNAFLIPFETSLLWMSHTSLNLDWWVHLFVLCSIVFPFLRDFCKVLRILTNQFVSIFQQIFEFFVFLLFVVIFKRTVSATGSELPYIFNVRIFSKWQFLKCFGLFHFINCW